MSSYLRVGGREWKPQEVAVAAVVSVSVFWTLKAVLRQIIRTLYPQGLPGEKNTVLLASARPNSATPPTVKDLENVVEYDYIIVGAGTAGCVLANRLSADPKNKVLAIEAGESDVKQLMSRIPAGVTKLWKTQVDWNFSTTPQDGCNGRALFWPRGKMIGGSSSINAMMYTKGAPDDYDELERLGNKGWAYKYIAPYLRMSERFTQPKDSDKTLSVDDLEQHGRSGPWEIGYATQLDLTKTFPIACDSLGIPKTQDINTDRGIVGATPVQTFIDSIGQRSSTAVAYLTADVVRRPNLKIASGQNVTKIIFDTSGAQPRAVGIEMASSKLTPVRYLVKARKEVILSAGSIGTPQLLKVSGIGPAVELKQHDIALVKELPGVGENLMDHVAFHGVTFKTDASASMHFVQDPIKCLPAVLEWMRHGTGAMTSQGCDSFAFLRTNDRDDAPAILRQNDHTSGKTSADLELMGLPLCFTQHGAFVAPLKDGYCTIAAVGLRPESRGNILLSSASMFDAPLIDPRALSTDYDIEVLLYGARLATRIAKSPAYAKFFKGWYIGPHHPLDWDTATDDQIKAHIRNSCETLYHPMGTAKMGPVADKDAVVDDELKVHGVQGLRVCDASIFPTALACHPCAAVVAAAEKAADMILESYA